MQDDKFYYTIRQINRNTKWTKRKILSEIAKIFDPMGLLGPTILFAKRIMQDLWRSGVQWNESVPQSIATERSKFVEQMEMIKNLSFERRILTDSYFDVQYHGFCDASERGYGACIYLRSSDDKGTIVVRLLCSKSRVAPLKPYTIPHLELCGALLLARLYKEAKGAKGITYDRTVFWCDSTVVLHWLNTAPHLLNIFVANRVVETQGITARATWRHVCSKDNPADALSRGQTLGELSRNTLWITGPHWLASHESAWPNDVLEEIEIPELKTNLVFSALTGRYDL